MDDSKKKILFKALAFTLAVMFLSLLFANLIYDWKKSDMDSDILEIYNKSIDLKITMNFFDSITMDTNSCGLIENQLVGVADFLYDLGKKVNLAVEDKDNITDIMALQKQHVYNSLELWLRLKKVNTLCPEHRRNYILYFYQYNCNECAPLETSIHDVKDKYGDKLWIFNFPVEIDIKTVNNILKYYDVNYIPAVVINDYVIYEQDIINNMDKYMFDYNAIE